MGDIEECAMIIVVAESWCEDLYCVHLNPGLFVECERNFQEECFEEIECQIRERPCDFAFASYFCQIQPLWKMTRNERYEQRQIVF